MNSGVGSSVSPVGPATIVVLGALVSTVKARLAGVGSTAPPLLERTANVCAPCFSRLYFFGDSQAFHLASSRLHWNFAPPAVEEKRNFADLLAVGPSGPDEMEVSGAGPADAPPLIASPATATAPRIPATLM